MRVLHTVPSLFDRDGGIVGGAERYALELARHMASEVPTTLLSFGPEEREEQCGDLTIRVLGKPWYVRGQEANPFSMRLFRQLSAADIVHCHQQHILASSAAAAFCRSTGRRVFVSDLGGGGWDVSSYIGTNRWYHGHLHISEYSRQIYRQRAWDRAHVIYGGVDTAKFQPPSTATKRDTVVFVGRVLPHKGVNYLVEAMPSDVRLEIIGQAYDEQYLTYLRSLAEGKCVAFHHDLNDDSLIESYQRALCVVLPSVYKTIYNKETRVPELLGQTLLEGMACGAPVICSNVASMPEIVVDGVTGFVVPPNDSESLCKKIEWLRHNREAAEDMGQKARQRVRQEFMWARVVKRCLEVYTR